MNKTSVKVSIVLPTYNGSRYLRQSIDSCLKQTHKNIELIIVDDGSTDNTPKIIQSYKDARIKYIKHEKNRGTPNALNTGFAYSTGEYLTWISDDNLYKEKAIEKMLFFLKEKEIEFVYCDFYLFENDDILKRSIMRLPDIPSLEKQDNVGPCFLYSRKVKEAVGDYNPDFFFIEDYDYWIRVSKKFPMGHLNEPLFFFRTHPASITSSRYYDTKINDALVRLSHNLVDVDQEVDYLINAFAGKYWGYRKINKITYSVFSSRKSGKVLKVFKNIVYGIYGVYRRINKIVVGIVFSRKIKKVLKDFKNGSLNLQETKIALRNILMRSEHIKEAWVL